MGPDGLGWRRILGMVIGLVGVAVLLGLDVHADDLIAVGEMLLSWSATRSVRSSSPAAVRLPSIGVVTASLIHAAVVYAPFAPFVPASTSAVRSGLRRRAAVFCTAIAFLVMFALIAEAGPARMTLITYVNPAVALLLGALVIQETIALGLLVGFALVIVGSILGTWGRAAPPPEAVVCDQETHEAVLDEETPATLTRAAGRPHRSPTGF